MLDIHVFELLEIGTVSFMMVALESRFCIARPLAGDIVPANIYQAAVCCLEILKIAYCICLDCELVHIFTLSISIMDPLLRSFVTFSLKFQSFQDHCSTCHCTVTVARLTYMIPEEWYLCCTLDFILQYFFHDLPDSTTYPSRSILRQAPLSYTKYVIARPCGTCTRTRQNGSRVAVLTGYTFRT